MCMRRSRKDCTQLMNMPLSHYTTISVNNNCERYTQCYNIVETDVEESDHSEKEEGVESDNDYDPKPISYLKKKAGGGRKLRRKLKLLLRFHNTNVKDDTQKRVFGGNIRK